MKWIFTHLLAALIGWGLISGFQPERETSSSLQPPQAKVTNAPPSKSQRKTAWVETWHQKLRVPLKSKADMDQRMQEMMTYFIEWMRADPSAALSSFGELMIPGRHNVLREGIGAARPEDAEIVFKEVQKLQGQGLYKMVGALGLLAGKVADQDPARAIRLIADFPAGSHRAAIMNFMLMSHSPEVGKELERLIPLQKELRQSPAEWKMIESHLQTLHLRNAASPK